MSTVQEFISFVKANGVARQNRFMITMNLPNQVTEKISKELDTSLNDGFIRFQNTETTNKIRSSSNAELAISIMAQTVNIPGLTVNAQDMRHQNSTRKIAYDKSYGDCDITFLASGNMLEKKVFDTWTGVIFRKDHTVAYFDDYVTDILIQQLDENDQVVYEYKLTEAYPSVIGPLTLDRTTSNQLQTFQVSFHFTKGKRVEDEIGTLRSSTGIGGIAGAIGNALGINIVIPDVVIDTVGFSITALDLISSFKNIKRQINSGTPAAMAYNLLNGLSRDVVNNSRLTPYEKRVMQKYIADALAQVKK